MGVDDVALARRPQRAQPIAPRKPGTCHFARVKFFRLSGIRSPTARQAADAFSVYWNRSTLTPRIVSRRGTPGWWGVTTHGHVVFRHQPFGQRATNAGILPSPSQGVGARDETNFHKCGPAPVPRPRGSRGG